MTIPKATIVVPFFNAAKTLERCINSVISQTESNWELILINDGSNDDSEKICLHFASADERIRVFKGIHEGVGGARNLGIKYARGRKLCFVDADDYIDPNYLSKLISHGDADLVVCGYNVDYLDESGQHQSTVPHNLKPLRADNKNERLALEPAFSLGFMCFIWNKLFDLKIIHENNIQFNSYPVNEDSIFVLDYLNYCSSIKLISDSPYHWIRVKGNLTAVSSLPENLLQIYEHSHGLLIKYFTDKNVADRIAYKSYELLIYKYLNHYRLGHISKGDCFYSLKLLNESDMVQDAFKAYVPEAKFEKIIYMLNQHGLFRLTFLLQTCIMNLKKIHY